MKYGEGNNKPHALTSMAGTLPAYTPTVDLSVTYTDFKKIATLKEGLNEYALTYGVDDQRRKAEFKENGILKQTRYYVGDYEEEIDALGNIRKIHYLSGAIMVQENGADKLYYTYSDNQGSLLALTNAGGTVVERYAYDPWGARRNPDNWTLKDTRTKWITNRGYTGHEHLDAFGIINMNGRVYDPMTAQFFSPDPYVQAPGNWLNYNRYGYCYNNPFKYTDPSGEFIITAMVAGAILNLAIQTMSGNVHSLGDAGIAAGIGALAGGAGAWAGSATSIALGGGTGFLVGGATGAAGGAAGGFVGGAGNAWMGGASFADGLETGLMGAGMGASSGGIIGAVSGGINAIQHKTNFWTGTAKLDLSKGYGAHNVKNVNQTITGKYIRQYQGVDVYESESMGSYSLSKNHGSGGITLPGRGIIVGNGVVSRAYDFQLLNHEFGHILQAKEWGLSAFYSEIAPESLHSAICETVRGENNYQHKTFWTETYANYLSSNYFGSTSTWDINRFPIKNLSSTQSNILEMYLPPR